ncbi:UNVERIFIED_ORG: Arm DNA-binding domain-containing protein [Roseateles sp. XES5]|nr:Arm DNA-binding domain-containing protein [Roseateles sp. XES5]
MAKLTKRVVDGLEPKEKDFFQWDDELPGFGVRVWPTGRKTYVAQYRSGGQTRRFKIGVHGPLTVEETRKEANQSSVTLRVATIRSRIERPAASL